MSQTKSRVMIYSSNVSDKNKGYGVLLEYLRQKKGYDILLDVLRRTDGLWYTPAMAQTNTKGMTYSSNVSHKNKCYCILLECHTQIKCYGILLECLRQKQMV